MTSANQDEPGPDKAIKRMFRRALLDARDGPSTQEIEVAVARMLEEWTGESPPTGEEADAVARAYLATHEARKAAEREARALKDRRDAANVEILLHAEETFVAVPASSTAPKDVVTAWLAGDKAAAVAWLASKQEAAVRRAVTSRGSPAALAKALVAGHVDAFHRVRNATVALRGPMPARARSFFSTFEETRDDVERLVALVETLAQADAVAQALAEEERERLRAEGERNRPIGVKDVRDRLGASARETDLWILDGRLPVKEWRTFRKWGKSLRTSAHDPAVVETLIPMVDEWRRRDGEAKSERRKAAARLTVTGQAERRFRAGLAKRAGLRMTDGLVSFGGVAVRPVEAGRAGFPTVPLTVAVEWPAEVEGATGASPTQADRAKAATALGTYVDGERERLQALVDGVVSAATPAAPEDAVRYVEHLRPRLSVLADVTWREDVIAAALALAFEGARTAREDERSDAGLKADAGLMDYAALFPAARAMKRRLVLHVGPTNSGKTHDAVQDMMAAASGTYLAPLRLMALETYDRLVERGVPASMVTGEERLGDPDARHASCTVEMADLETEVDVAVVDEVQMILDAQRGWAWTQAVVGMPARTLHLTGSPDAVAHVRRIAAMTSDDLVEVRHERKTPLVALPYPVDRLEPGDAIVAFSRGEVMRLRRLVGRHASVATVYGALGPEVRRSEARRFRSGEASVLVATDAIAMGLNLPIRRVLFSALQKYDGSTTRDLTHSEVRQIGGRAGRFGLAESGQVGLLDRSFGGTALAATMVAKAISLEPIPPAAVRLPVMPPWRAVRAVSAALGTEDLRRILTHVSERLLRRDPVLSPGDMVGMMAIADATAGTGLGLRDRFGYLGCPVDASSPEATGLLRRWASDHAGDRTVAAPATRQRDVPDTDAALQGCESVVKGLSAYLWLAQRWPDAYADFEAASAERDRVNVLIEGALARKSLARSCRSCGRKLPDDHRFAICEPCFQDQRGR